jgi:hypothetical protein
MTVVRTIAATPGQRLLWMMEHYRGEDSPLNVPTFYRLRGQLDRQALQTAVDDLVTRHEALRTTYESVRGRLLQHVHEPHSVPLQHEVVEPAELEAAMVRHARARFDLSESVFHPVLLEIAPDDYVLVLSIHHLSTDGWSGGVLSGELGRLYRPAGAGPAETTSEMAPVSWQYAEFAEWQQQRFDSGVLAAGQEFWRTLLKGAHLPSLPGEASSRSGVGQLPGTIAFSLAPATVADLAKFCKANRVTTYIAGLALFGAVLQVQTGENDLAFASMFANRSRPELIGTVGFLANLMVLRLSVGEQPSFRELLVAARDVLLDALAYQEVPYHLVPRSRDERPTDLETILFQMAAGPSYGLEFAGVEAEQLDSPDGVASRFDLEFVLMPEGTAIKGLMWFDRRRFSTDWAQRFISDYQQLAARAIAEPDRPLAELLSGQD